MSENQKDQQWNFYYIIMIEMIMMVKIRRLNKTASLFFNWSECAMSSRSSNDANNNTLGL